MRRRLHHSEHGERDGDVQQGGARIGEHQGREEDRAAGDQSFARDGRFGARAGERDGDHHQEEGAEIAQRAGLIEQALGAAVDSGIEPDELRSVSGGRGELEVEIDAGEEGRGDGCPVEKAGAAHGVRPPSGSIGAVEEDVDGDAEEERRGPRCRPRRSAPE